MRAVMQGRVKMREVKVNRAELLETIRVNRKVHVREYLESVIGYKEAALSAIDRAMGRLKNQVEDLEAGEVLRLAAVTFNLKIPENHNKDYDQVIKMLEMCVDDQLTIKSDEFACYVMDDWDWKDEFNMTKSTYSSSSSSSRSSSSSTSSDNVGIGG